MAHRFPIRVYFEDTDAGGIAYHANYLRWAERARTEALRDMGLPHALLMEQHDSILLVRRLEVAYERPARLDDALVVETETAAMRAATVTLRQRVSRDGAHLATLVVELACIGRADGRPRRIPEPWRSALAAGVRSAHTE